MRTLAAAVLPVLIVLFADVGAAAAQQLGPPIPPDQMMRQQNQPISPIPSPPVPATPPPSASTPSQVPSVRGEGGDRVTRCQHQAAEQRVPRHKRQSYVHNCMSD